MKTSIIILVILFIIGCSFDNKNSQNANQNTFKIEPLKKSYVICTIKCSIAGEKFLGTYKNYYIKTYISEVKEVFISSSDDEYRLLDKFERETNEIAVYFREWDIKILSRQCLKFSSYTEASQVRLNLLN